MASLTVIDEDNSATHVVIAGPLDLAGVQSIERDFSIQTTARRRATVVDVSAVESISSLGIGMLVQAARGLRLHGHRLVLLAPTPVVERVLRATRVTELLPIAHGLEEARALLRDGRTGA